MGARDPPEWTECLETSQKVEDTVDPVGFRGAGSWEVGAPSDTEKDPPMLSCGHLLPSRGAGPGAPKTTPVPGHCGSWPALRS